MMSNARWGSELLCLNAGVKDYPLCQIHTVFSRCQARTRKEVRATETRFFLFGVRCQLIIQGFSAMTRLIRPHFFLGG